MSQIFQEDLASLDLGINLQIRPMEVALFVDTINAQPPKNQGMWFANASRANLGSPLTMFTSTSVLWSTERHADGFGINNTGYYSDAYKGTIDALLMESNPDEQRRLYSQLNDIVLEDNWITFVGPKPPRIVA